MKKTSVRRGQLDATDAPPRAGGLTPGSGMSDVAEDILFGAARPNRDSESQPAEEASTRNVGDKSAGEAK